MFINAVHRYHFIEISDWRIRSGGDEAGLPKQEMEFYTGELQ